MRDPKQPSVLSGEACCVNPPSSSRLPRSWQDATRRPRVAARGEVRRLARTSPHVPINSRLPMIQKAFAVLVALVILTFAHDRSWAQTSQTRVMLADGDAITKEEASAVLRTIQEELNQLVVRLRGASQRNEDPVTLLAGQNVGRAMMLVLAVKPKATTRMIGMVGKRDNQQSPSFVLYDISGWVDKGRPLGFTPSVAASRRAAGRGDEAGGWPPIQSRQRCLHRCLGG